MPETPDDKSQPINEGLSVSEISEALASARADIVALKDLLSAAEAAKATILEHLVLSTRTLADIQVRDRELATAATQSLAARTQITDAQAVIATKSDHIQNAQAHADKVRGDLDRSLTAAQTQLTDIEGSKARAKAAADTAAEMQVAATASKTAAEVEMGAVKRALEGAVADSAKTQALADKAAIIEERIAQYENTLKELHAGSATQLKTILALLPGATSAGLASAFDMRRKTFLEPTKRWQAIFVGSIALLVLLAATGVAQAYFSRASLNYDDLLRLWILRLPIAASLIWLALHSSREASLAKRLEEDYGFKSAISSSFQGFQQQMKEIGVSAAPGSPLGKLCEDTLATLASHPGRIYEKHALTITPAAEIAEIVKATVEAVLPKRQ